MKSSPSILHYVVSVKSSVKIWSIFVAFLENTNFNMRLVSVLEPSCRKKRQKSPNQETGLGNRGCRKVLNNTKLVLNEPE